MNAISISDLSNIWSELATVDESELVLGVPALSTGVNTGYGTVRLALSQGRRPTVLVPISATSRITINGVPKTLQLGDSKYRTKTGSVRFLQIELLDERLTPVFMYFVKELLKRLGAGDEPANAIRMVLADFRKLLEAEEKKGIGRASLIGILGELIVLNQMLGISTSAWKAWLGPTGARHDFKNGINALEVKATTAAEPVEIEVASIHQLEWPTGGQLTLCVIALERNVGGTVSLEQEIQKARDRVSDREGFEQLMQAAFGSTTPTNDELSSRFTVRSFQKLRVSDGFPSITESSFAQSLPSQVTSLRYSLLIAGLEKFVMREQEWEKHLWELANA